MRKLRNREYNTVISASTKTEVKGVELEAHTKVNCSKWNAMHEKGTPCRHSPKENMLQGSLLKRSTVLSSEYTFEKQSMNTRATPFAKNTFDLHEQTKKESTIKHLFMGNSAISTKQGSTAFKRLVDSSARSK